MNADANYSKQLQLARAILKIDEVLREQEEVTGEFSKCATLTLAQKGVRLAKLIVDMEKWLEDQKLPPKPPVKTPTKRV